MRKPRLIGATAAAAVLAGSVIAGGTAAYAAAPDAEAAGQSPAYASNTGQTPAYAPNAEGPAPTTVTLPTGDRVTVLPNGTTAIEPASGREDISFFTPPSPSGDIVVVPTDQVAAIEAGEEDPRRYNVTELLKTGQTDAASADESELDERPYAGLIPDTSPAATAVAEEDVHKLRVSVRDRSGEAPDGIWIIWVARDGSDFGRIPMEANGEGGTALPPGDYVIASGFWSDATETERGQLTMGMIPVTIENAYVDLKLDGNDAQPVSVDVEQEDAQFLNASMVIEARQGDMNIGYGNFLGPQDDAFLLPEPDLAEFTQGFLYQAVLASPAGAEDSYAYNLAFHDGAGYPDDTAFSVADEDLAAVETDYRELGVPYGSDVSDTCDYGDLTDRQIGLGFCRLIQTALPSQRTMYYTADPEIIWENGLAAGERDENGDIVNGFAVSYDAIFEPGQTERVMPRGGLAAGISSGARLDDEGTNIMYAPVSPIGGGNDESLVFYGVMGEWELSRDGQTIATGEEHDFYWQNVYTPLPEGDAGRYTLAADVTKASTGTVFGTDASIEWRFDSVPVEAGGERNDIVLPSVQLVADDIEGGYGERDGCQELTLELRSDPYGPVVHAEDMTFEVSYNDGRTWREIRIDRDGDTATAELDHPRGAKWVSVRMTALDDAGTEVEHTTIRAYGLK